MPEIRGILTVIIAVVVFIGSVYLLLGTNVGARLGFLLSIAGARRRGWPRWVRSGGPTASG